MRKRGVPVVILAALVLLGLALTVINLMTAPPELNPIGEQGMSHAGHSHHTPPPSKEKPRTPEEIAKDIEATTEKAPAPPAPTRPTMVEVIDRDDEGSGNWWDDTASPPPPGGGR